VIDRYSLELLTSDVTAMRGKVRTISDQLRSCGDTVFKDGVTAFLQARLSFFTASPCSSIV